MPDSVSFSVNGGAVHLDVDGDRRLLWVLRTELGLTGTKYSCGEGHCGACTVLVDNKPVRACQKRVRDLKGREVTTIEGLERDGRLHPVQEAFVGADALQCGYCTPGMVMQAVGLLRSEPNPSAERILHVMEHNFCRCGAHPRIVSAVQAAARSMKGGG